MSVTGRAGALPRCPLALLLAAAALGGALPLAAVTGVAIATVPDAPTWQDDVQVVVTGVAGSACGAASVRLSGPLPGSGSFIELALDESCSSSGPIRAEPFSVRRDLGQFLAGTYGLVVLDGHGVEVGSAPLVVHEVGNGLLRLPPVASSDVAPTIETSFLRCPLCSSTVQLTVQGSLIVITYSSTVPVFPFLGPNTPTTAHVQLPLLAPGIYEVQLVTGGTASDPLVKDTLRVWDAAHCVPSDTSLCLQKGRFRVTGSWRDPQGSTGAAHPAPLPGNEASGLLWFFDAANAELTVKVLDGCGLNGHWWTFVASGSTVEYDLTVSDTWSGQTRTYHHAPGSPPALVADTDSFGSCGG